MEASRPAGPARPEGTNDGALGAAVFVWTLWAVMTAAAAYYVTACATNVPFWDEWDLVPLVTGHEPLDLKTLWQSVNEHRLPLIKLTLVGLVRATGDFRSQAWLNLALLSATAAGLVLAASHLRGRVAYSDAFFPVVLLHWGHFELYTGQITLNHTLASVLQLVVLAAVVLRPGGLNRAALAAVALCLVALPLCGANGLPVVLTAAAWLGWAAVWAWGEGRRGWALAHLAAAAAGAGMVGLYLHSYVRPPGVPLTESLHPVVRTGAQALGMPLTGWNRELWPAIGFATPVALLAGAVLAVTGGVRKWPAERLRAPGLLLLLAASASQAAAIGWARAFQGPESGTPSRYGVVLLPPVVAAYFAAVLYEGRAWRGLLPAALLALALAFLPGRMTHGWYAGQATRERLEPLGRDAETGAATDRLAEKYAGVAYPDAARLERCLRYLSGTRYGPLGRATVLDPGAYGTLWLPVPDAHVAVDMAGGPRWTSTGPDPHLLYRVDPDGLPAVRMLRLVYRLKALDGPVAQAEVFWSGGDRDGFAHETRERYWTRRLIANGVPQTLVIPIDGPLKWIRIDPSTGPCEFELLGLAAVVPAAGR